MGTFLISKRKNDEYQFNLRAENGEIILSSEGYFSKMACKNGIESVRKNSTEDNRYERKTSTNGKYYFNLKAANSQVIGTSEMYETSSGRDNGINAVKQSAPTATISDIS